MGTRVIQPHRLFILFTIFSLFLAWVIYVLPIFHFTMLADLLLPDDEDQN